MMRPSTDEPSRVDVVEDLTLAIQKLNWLSPVISKQRNKQAVELIRSNSNKILQEQPEALALLRKDIELVTLEALIKKFESMLEQRLKEGSWQTLFAQNPFILNMAFGIPIITVREQTSTGGLKISGSGQKIADFLVKNSLTNNAGLVEIKTPDTKLVLTTAYRSEVHGPSADRTNAINQVLDQIHKLQKYIATIKEASRIYDLETYSVTGVLIIGRSPVDPKLQNSFELYKSNFKNIQIVTFDELLSKLKKLLSFLKPNL